MLLGTVRLLVVSALEIGNVHPLDDDCRFSGRWQLAVMLLRRWKQHII